MWFKNISVYKFTQAFGLDRDTLQEALQTQVFTPCGSQDEFSFGFVAPIEPENDLLVRYINGCLVICGKREDKVLPSSAIKQELQRQIKDLEEREARKIPGKERTRMKEELIFNLLPKAMTVSKKTYAYIDVENGYLVVDAASSKKAEDLLSQLRKCLGSLPVVPIGATHSNAESTMTQWLLNNDAPAGFVIDDECELRSMEEEGGIIRCKRQHLDLPEIKNHLDSGKLVHKLALTWQDRISFTLDAELGIKRVKFLDLIQEKAAEIEAVDEVEQFEADFTIMAGEITNLLNDLIEAFGELPKDQE